MALVRVRSEEVAEALSTTPVNAIFRLEYGLPDAGDADGWSQAVGLCHHDGATLAKLIGAVGECVGARERRVAASLMVMGYSIRLIAPSVAALLCNGLVLDLKPETVWWRYQAGNGFLFRLSAPGGWRHTDKNSSNTEPLYECWCRVLVDGHLVPVIAAVRRVAPVAEGLLWGNVASSLAGSLRTIALAGLVPLPRYLATCMALFAREPFKGVGTLAVRGGQLFFIRRSCCLYYRLPGGDLCGDCALLDQAKRERQWTHAVCSVPGG